MFTRARHRTLCWTSWIQFTLFHSIFTMYINVIFSFTYKILNCLFPSDDPVKFFTHFSPFTCAVTIVVTVNLLPRMRKHLKQYFKNPFLLKGDISVCIDRDISILIDRDISILIDRDISILIYRDISIFTGRNISIWIDRDITIYIHRDITIARHRSWANRIQFTPWANLPKIYSYPILPSTPWSSEWSLSFGLPHEKSRTVHVHSRPPLITLPWQQLQYYPIKSNIS
jgi:hypothetical protein